jgi:hypothetical protein
MNIRFGAKHAPFIRTPGAKKLHPKIQPFPHHFGGEMVRGYGIMQKKALMFEYLGLCDRY